MTTAWQTNGGFAIEIAGEDLEPGSDPQPVNDWREARHVERRADAFPVTIEFYGRGVALNGAIGADCCEPGHARVFVDGQETNDGTGIWQNKSSSGKTLPDSVLFAWQWNAPAYHTITVEPGMYNAKEGAAFIELAGYDVLP